MRRDLTRSILTLTHDILPATCEDQTSQYESSKQRNISVKAAGDKLLMNKFIRQNFGGGRTLKNFRS